MAARNTKNETENVEIPVIEDDDEFGGFFDGVDDIEDVSDDPFFMEDGVYTWKIVEAFQKKTNAGDKTGLNVKLQCASGAYKGNTQFAPWRRVPKMKDTDIAEAMSQGGEAAENMQLSVKKQQAQLKKDFIAYGVGVDEMKDMRPDPKTGVVQGLLGREVQGRIKNSTKEDGTKERRIIGLYVVDEVSGEDGLGGFGQFSDDSPF